MPSKIFVKGARENNLKNIDVEIPRDALTVITGLSGSGKSSLAFDTIYAEGQRRYVESLSSYARMFLGQKEKPDVDYIEGLSPAISIDQKTTSQNPRSTVGTVTEVYDYLRLLWARVGTPHCPNCGKEIRQQSIDQIIDQLMALGEGTRVQIMAPVIRGKKGEHVKIFEDARRSGYVRVRADGNMYDLSEEISLEKNKKHNIEVVVDRLILRLYKLPANLVIFLKIVDNGITHDHKFAITLGISFIHRNNRNRYRSRIAVWIPVRIDIKPCIQGWKHADCKCDQKRKLISPQPLHITFENPENSPHSLVLLHLFLFLSSNIYYNVFCY